MRKKNPFVIMSLVQVGPFQIRDHYIYFINGEFRAYDGVTYLGSSNTLDDAIQMTKKSFLSEEKPNLAVKVGKSENQKLFRHSLCIFLTSLIVALFLIFIVKV